MSIANYDALLISLSNQADSGTLASNATFGAANINYSSAAVAARNNLTDNYGWQITDGGLV